jgi:ribonuclease J
MDNNQNPGGLNVAANSNPQQNTNNIQRSSSASPREGYAPRQRRVYSSPSNQNAGQGNPNQGPNRPSRGGYQSRNTSQGPRTGGQGNRNYRGGQGGQNRRFSPNRGNTGGQIIRKRRFPDEMIQTSSAKGWNDSKNYQFKDNYEGTKLRLIPISGLEMIGTNCTVLEYENDIMIIDAGLGFPDIDQVGIDSLVPNLSYVYDKIANIRGLVITHGHTDHIGGLSQIYDKIGFPTIYAPRLAAEMIREKFKETGFADRAKIVEIDGDSSYYLGKFHLSHFRMNHTIMDNYGIVIDTPVGRIMTPSDYKFDLTPYKESPSDYSKLAKLGDEGVLLLMDESTNVKIKGWAPSESAIAHDLEDTIRDSHGRLIIGMFSTMISRIRQIMEISARYNKKVAVLGRSLETNAKISHRLGYIDVTTSTFIPLEEIRNYPDDQIVILTTGSQGEPNAALMRMAYDEHRRIQLKQSDTVVFSSSRIPGNEGRIDKLINKIAEKGVRILTNDHLTLHASGHGCKEDHKLMLQLTKPKFLLPIHGEASMLAANKELAMGLGMKEENVIIGHDGAVIELWPDGWKIVDTIESSPLWVEGNRVGDFDLKITEERKLLSDEGVIVVTLKNFASEQITLQDIEITHKGFFVQNKDNYMRTEFPNKIVEVVNRMNPDRDKENVRVNLHRQVEREIEMKYEKKPLIIVSLV